MNTPDTELVEALEERDGPPLKDEKPPVAAPRVTGHLPTDVLLNKEVRVFAMVDGSPKRSDFDLSNRMGRRRFEQLCLKVAQTQIKKQIAVLARQQGVNEIKKQAVAVAERAA